MGWKGIKEFTAGTQLLPVVKVDLEQDGGHRTVIHHSSNLHLAGIENPNLPSKLADWRSSTADRDGPTKFDLSKFGESGRDF